MLKNTQSDFTNSTSELMLKNLSKLNQPIQSIYISGPITGLPDLNFQAFKSCQSIINDIGYKGINPFDLVSESDQNYKSWEYFMRVDIKRMMELDVNAIVMLQGFEKSSGAITELLNALILKIPVLSESGHFLFFNDRKSLDILINPIIDKVIKNQFEFEKNINSAKITD